MTIAVASLGSSTFTTWNRRVSAASFSKYFLYSAQVVAAMVRNSPRAEKLRRATGWLCPTARARGLIVQENGSPPSANPLTIGRRCPEAVNW